MNTAIYDTDEALETTSFQPTKKCPEFVFYCLGERVNDFYRPTFFEGREKARAERIAN